jgi:hypothetical protein
MKKRQWLARIAGVACALALVAVFFAPAERAVAAETWTSVTALNGQSTTLPDGTTVGVSLTQANQVSFWSNPEYNAPALKYATISNTTAASLTFTFSRPMSDLKFYYGFVNLGDPFVVSTNVSQDGLDFTDSSLVTSALPYACTGNCAGTGTLTSSGLIADAMVSGSVYSGVLTLHFDTPITTFTVVNPRTIAGVNGVGIEVRSYAVVYDTQGGSTVASTPYLPGATNVTLAAAPTRSGHRFTGWFEDALGGSPLTSPLGERGAEDTPVFAQWVPLTISPGTQTISGVPGTAITPTTAFTPAEFSGTPTYSVTGTLPDGLTLDTTTGVISGTPVNPMAAQTFTITGTYLTETATSTVTISVAAPSISPATQTISGVQGTPITPTAPFTPTGLGGTPTYSISDDLPQGLSLDTTTGVISGTPENEMEALNYTITATYLTKTATSSLTISVAAANNAGGEGLAFTGMSIGILSAVFAAGIGLVVFAFFFFSGKRRLHLFGIDAAVSSRLHDLNAAFARMDAAQRRARARLRRTPKA